MRRRSCSALLLLGLVLVLVGSAPASAASERVKTTNVPLNATLANPCTAEAVLFTGNLDATVTESTNAAGNVRITVSTSIQDATAVGVPSGLKYIFKSKESMSDVVPLGDGTYSVKLVERLSFKRVRNDPTPMPGDDLIVVVTIHGKITPTLDIVTEKIDYALECK